MGKESASEIGFNSGLTTRPDGIILGIETSCDETAVGLFCNGRLLGHVVTSQVKIHAEYGGVVPELASREHLKNLLPILRALFGRVGIMPEDVSCVAATRGPGLPGALMIGWRFAQAFAFARQIPCYGTQHHEAHLYSAWYEEQRFEIEQFEPNISLIVSGGHTILVDVSRPLQHEVLGETLDDAAGECFDKTAKLLGLPYPGGPAIEKLAAIGDPAKHAFPRPMIDTDDFCFSFSGLKTAVRYYVQDHPELLASTESVADLCASVQAAIVDVLVTKTIRAASHRKRSLITVSGGVACNRALRERLQAEARRYGIKVRFASPEFCTDNAAMVCALAWLKQINHCPSSPFELDIDPSWTLQEVRN